MLYNKIYNGINDENEVCLLDIDYKAIGKRIKLARIQMDMQQDLLAEKAGISPSHMSNIETGKTKVSLVALVSIANALMVSVDDLLCDNVKHSKAVFAKEAKALFDDSSDYETKVMVKAMGAIKEAIRENQRLLEED